MFNLIDLTSPWRNKSQAPVRVHYQPLSPKEKALVDRLFGVLVPKENKQ